MEEKKMQETGNEKENCIIIAKQEIQQWTIYGWEWCTVILTAAEKSSHTVVVECWDPHSIWTGLNRYLPPETCSNAYHNMV